MPEFLLPVQLVNKNLSIVNGMLDNEFNWKIAARNGMLCEKRVLLLDGGPKLSGYDEKVYSNRVFAINQNTVKLMEQIGAWDTIKSIRCRPVKQMQV